MGFFYTSPGKQSLPYLDELQRTSQQRYQPYSQAGMNAFQSLGPQYEALMNNPAAFMSQLGQGYQQSPGFNFAMQQALAAGNQAAAAGGMAGSPMNQRTNMELATQLSNQDYLNYLDRVSNFYGMGLQGTGQMAQQGYDALNRMQDMDSSAIMQKASNAYSGAIASNEFKQNLLKELLAGISYIYGFRKDKDKEV